MAQHGPKDEIRVANADLWGQNLYRIARKVVTSAQLLTLAASPVTIAGAPGNRFSWIPLYAVFYKQAGTAYTVAADRDFAIRYTDGAGTVLLVQESTGFMDQTTVQRRVTHGFATLGAGTPASTPSVTPTENAALVLDNAGAAEFATGTGSLIVEVYGFKALTSPQPAA